MSEWKTTPLGDLLDGGQVSYGVVQPGVDSATGVPIVRVKDIRNGLIDTSAPMRVDKEISDRHRRTLLSGGELLLSLVGTVGEVAVVPAALNGWNVARAVAVVRSSVISSRWLQLCFETQTVTSELESLLNTTVQSTLNLSDLKRIGIPVPPEGVRDAIEEVLGALDDKIAANAKLASIADEWVRAGFEGLQAVETKTIAELVTAQRDQVGPAALNGDILYVGLEHVPRRSMWLGEIGSAANVTSHKHRFVEGDILFGKLRPYFHKVVTAPYSGVCSTDILVLKANDPTLCGIALAAVASDLVVREVTSASEGTRMPRTSWKDLASVEVPWPGDALAKKFSADVSIIRKAVEGKLRENRTLAATRDALLPQLMSGALRIKDAEKAIEGML